MAPTRVPREVAQQETPGRGRSQADDRVRIVRTEEIAGPGREGVFVVIAGGEGTREMGGVVADLVARTITHAFFGASPSVDVAERLSGALREGGRAMRDRTATDATWTGARATALAAVVANGRLTVANVGAGRAYTVGDRVRQITRDHTVVDGQGRNGPLTESEASDRSHGHLITRYFAGHFDVDIDLFDVTLRPDDAVVLCSDGLHAVVSDREICRAVARDSVDEAADAIVRLARERETADDACVVVIGRGKPEEPMIRIGLPHRRSVLMLAGGLLLVAAIAIFQSGRGPPATSSNIAVTDEAGDAAESATEVAPVASPTWVVETPTSVVPTPTSTFLPPPAFAVAALDSSSSPTPAATVPAILDGLASPPPEEATPTVGGNPTRRPATVTSKAATRTAKSPAPPTGTPTRLPESPTPAYPPPVLRPAEVASGAVALSWTYAGQLAADEYFDVRVWAKGQPANGIANLKQPSYIIAGSFPAGTYSWTIAVVRRASDGTVLTLASAAQILSFSWSGSASSGSCSRGTAVGCG